MSKEKDTRKGKIVTIGENLRKRIPALFSTIYRIVTTAVTDGEDVEKDETFKLHTLRTVTVEGLSVNPDGKSFNINGEFDISLESEDNDTEESLRDRTYTDQEEAIKNWRYLSNLQRDKVKAEQERLEKVYHCIDNSIEKEQY